MYPGQIVKPAEALESLAFSPLTTFPGEGRDPYPPWAPACAGVDGLLYFDGTALGVRQGGTAPYYSSGRPARRRPVT
jgi:hypothetical protein